MQDRADELEARFERIGDEINELIDGINRYRGTQLSRRALIQRSYLQLEERYTQLQFIPESDMSLTMRQRVSEKKTDILVHMQEMLEMIPEDSIQTMPTAAQSAFLKSGKKYSRSQLAVFVEISDILFSYGQHKQVSFNELSRERQMEISNFVTSLVVPTAQTGLTPEELAQFNEEVPTFTSLTCDLLANIMGVRTPFPPAGDAVGNRVLCQTCIIVIGAEDRSFADSVEMIVESTDPFEAGKTLVKGGVVAAATVASFPAITSAAGALTSGAAAVGGPAVTFSIENPLFAYGTLHHLWACVTAKMDDSQNARNPDFVYRRWATSLSQGMEQREIDGIFGRPPLQPGDLGLYPFARILDMSARFVVTTCRAYGQAASNFAKTSFVFPGKASKFCQQVGHKITTATSIIANRLIGKKRLTTGTLFTRAHNVLESLLQTEEYADLQDSPTISAILQRMGILDGVMLRIEKVRIFEARDAATGNTRYLKTKSETQTADYGGDGDTMDLEEFADYRIDARADTTARVGEHGEVLGTDEPKFANRLDLFPERLDGPEYKAEFGSMLFVTIDEADRRGEEASAAPARTTIKKQPPKAAVHNAASTAPVLTVNAYKARLNHPVKGKKGNGAADADAANMSDQDGGRSRSRKRSASKRTRRRKSTTKKQKSKKNKRQSRRKVRRSSSRKVGRK
jgi:hypothetical protein